MGKIANKVKKISLLNYNYLIKLISIIIKKI